MPAGIKIVQHYRLTERGRELTERYDRACEELGVDSGQLYVAVSPIGRSVLRHLKERGPAGAFVYEMKGAGGPQEEIMHRMGVLAEAGIVAGKPDSVPDPSAFGRPPNSTVIALRYRLTEKGEKVMKTFGIDADEPVS